MAYKEAFARLRELKQEIEHLQMLLEQSRTKLQKDFEHWMTLMLRQQQAASAVTAGELTRGSPSASSLPNRPVHRYLVTFLLLLSPQRCMLTPANCSHEGPCTADPQMNDVQAVHG